MAKKLFQKGNPGGPGRPVLPKELKAIRYMGHQDVAEIGQMIIAGDVNTLLKIVNKAATEAKRLKEDPNCEPDREYTPLQMMIASVAVKAIQKGDVTQLNGLLDRLVGRVPASIFVKTMSENPTGSEAKVITFEVLGENKD